MPREQLLTYHIYRVTIFLQNIFYNLLEFNLTLTIHTLILLT
jgi:hypothetical protein